MSTPAVSIIVPAYNCEETIRDCIQKLLDQTFCDHEVIIVDDGSTDRTPDVIKEFSQVKYVYQENAGPAKARNRGLEEAQGDIVFFTDSDCLARPDWIERMVRRFTDIEVAVVCGSYGIANNENLLARCIHQEIEFRHRVLVSQYPKVFGSYNFGIRKSVFKDIGGFNESYRYASGEDNDLSYKVIRAGNKIYFERDALVDHYHPTHLGKYLKEQCRHGFWRVKMYKDHARMAKGDEYTFWKDIVEVPLAFLLTILFFLWLFGVGLLFIPLVTVFTFTALMELFYGYKITRGFMDGIYLSLVMFLRLFFRTFGFLKGAAVFLPGF